MVGFKDIPAADRVRFQIIVHRDIKRQLDHLAIDRRVSTSELVNEFLGKAVFEGSSAARVAAAFPKGRRKLAPSR